MNNRKSLSIGIVITLSCFFANVQAQQKSWWKLAPNGGTVWTVKNTEAHTDHIEMSGKKISAIVTYGVNASGNLVLNKRIIFPLLRTIPNDTRGSLWKNFTESVLPTITVGGERIEEIPTLFQHNDIMTIVTHTKQGLRIERKIYPSVDKPVYVEKYKITNTTAKVLKVEVEKQDKTFNTDSAKGVDGVYNINYKTYNDDLKILAPLQSDEFSIVFSAKKAKDPIYYIDANYEQEKRKAFVDELKGSLVLKTPDSVLNTFFAFAKLRATESIYDTKGGLMHSPGGANYYAALWANDQGEFTSPLFPFIGNSTGNASAINCYRTFATYINPEYQRLPSSIVAEGTAEGVIASETDGEEGRFKTGKANLYVNSLAYSGFLMASRLAKQLQLPDKEAEFAKEAALLRKNMDQYFKADILGYTTYKYHKDATTLYAWAGMPLAMGISNYAVETQAALFSKEMWAKDVMLSESGNTKRYFERPMLNAFRGLFFSGYKMDTTLKYFKAYTALRLLGEHVPYVVEAYPEGNGRHLAGDNALYCRIITEGLFGIEPIAFNQFNISPRLPSNWNEMSLSHIKAFNGDFNILVKRKGKRILASVVNKGNLMKQVLWDGDKPIKVEFSEN